MHLNTNSVYHLQSMGFKKKLNVVCVIARAEWGYLQLSSGQFIPLSLGNTTKAPVGLLKSMPLEEVV